jgi:hypothetical protein
VIEVFFLNMELEDFEKINVEENIPLFDLLDSEKIMLFTDPSHDRIWIWEGKNTSTREKFISSQLVSRFRDTHYLTSRISSVDEGEETAAFKILVGLVK